MIEQLTQINLLLEEELTLAEQGNWEELLIKEQHRNKLTRSVDVLSKNSHDYDKSEEIHISELLDNIKKLESELLNVTEKAQIENRQTLKQSQHHNKAAKTYSQFDV